MDKKILAAYGSKRCFGGKLELKKMNPFEKWIINKVKAPEGDFRNWKDIVFWAETIFHDCS